MKSKRPLVQNKVLGGGLLLNNKPLGFSCALMR